MATKRGNPRLLLVPLGIGLFLALLYALPFYANLENGVYDIFLRLKPAVSNNDFIVLLNIDDQSIDNVGQWPWPRSLIGDGLVLLREFDARYAVFDIEYLNRSPAGVDTWYLENGLKNDFATGFADISSSASELIEAVANGQLKPRDALAYMGDLNAFIDETGKTLLERARSVAVDNDIFLGQAMKLFGASFPTLNVQQSLVALNSPELRSRVADRYSYAGATEKGVLPEEGKDFFIPIEPVLAGGRKLGYTNVLIDGDGTRRRIDLFKKIGGRWYPQLVLAPLLDLFGMPVVEIGRSAITLKDARFPDGTVRTVAIPLDEGGNMLLNWPKSKFVDSYSHVSFYHLVDLGRRESDLSVVMSNIAQGEAWKIPDGSGSLDAFLMQATALKDEALEVDGLRRAAIASGSDGDFGLYLAAKKACQADISDFLRADIAGAMDKAVAGLDANALGPELLAKAKADAASFIALVAGARERKDAVAELRDRLGTTLSGRMCVIGYTGTGSTDIGVNPFQSEYPNVGTHATVANTILERAFLDATPVWFSGILSVILAIGLVAVIRRMKPALQNVIGIGATLGILVAAFAVFLATGVYVAVLSPAIAVFLSFLVHSIMAFLSNEREKSFLRKAFSTYLSGDVIEELIADPDRLKLGGDRRELTAVFTDIRGFSTISEQLDPSQLVDLLNAYLSTMSDTILDERGTIDKYEGDAIISFFGAPLPLPTHARAACRAAVLMKRKEAVLNTQFMESKLSPLPLFTRIGVNTGDMVVGNMGTQKKMDYTIMGNAVNLAARLEGVNKRYGSWILASETTVTQAGDDFLARRMDRVRVVGINTPVQLYEIVDLKADADPARVDYLSGFHDALDLFEAKDWQKARSAFDDLVKRDPVDGPSQYYQHRCEDFLKKAPSDTWDGVFNLTEK
ncbi:MAG: CHASE2 domain-containing protein [Spirochaetes bacterium]|nr:CHASE2 domain-containing protein [Spirochaetota bacterium]